MNARSAHGRIGSWWIRTRPGLLRAVLTIAALAASLGFVVKAVPAMKAAEANPPWDGFIDWGGARETLAGHDPYSEESLKAVGLSKNNGLSHPPTTLVWFFPLAHFDMMMMRHVFSIITLLLLLYHVGIVLREVRLPGWPVVTLLVFSAVFQTDWFIVHLFQVDLSELIAFLYVMSWYFLRRDRPGWAGVMAGLACTLKLYPGLLVVFLLLAGKRRAVITASATYALFALEMVRRVGISSFRNFMQQTGSPADTWIADIRNASISGIVHRCFYPLWQSFPAGRPVSTRAMLIAGVISLAILVAAWAVSRRSFANAVRDPKQLDLPFALFSVLSMAPGPYQWEHYNVTLILPLFVLLADVWRRAREDARWFEFVGTTAVLCGVVAMLNVKLARRMVVGREAATLPLSEVLFYEWTAWLPWLVVSVVLGIRLFRSPLRGEAGEVARRSVASPSPAGA